MSTNESESSGHESLGPESMGPELYMNRIDAAVAASESLQALLRAVLQESKAAKTNGRVRILLRALEDRVPAERWLRDEELVSLLPAVLRLSDLNGVREWNCGMMRQLIAPRSMVLGRTLREFGYPIMILLLGLGVLIVMASTVVPTFRQMFREFELRLPAPTHFIFELSDALTGRSIWTAVLLVLLALGLWFLLGGLDWVLSRARGWSFFGYWLAGTRGELNAMAQWSAMLAELIAIDTPLAEAMRLAGVGSGDPFYRNQAAKVASRIEQGDGSWSTSSVARGFSPTVLRALTAGRDSRPSVSVMRQMAEIYWERIEQRKHGMGGAWAGPLALVFVGLLVGFVVIALFMPLISMVTSLSS
jgi:type IV pilus assembly protein PilC